MTAASAHAASRGRIDKRHAILDAAITVFARQGYAQACVKEIAAEASVAKPTVYNHLTDKANLFRQAVEAAADALHAENLAALDGLTRPGDDLRAALEDTGRRLLRHHCSERSTALRRLLHAEGTRFPDLLGLPSVDPRTLATALADRLARLCVTGRLRLTDPDRAAEQFLALLTGPVDLRSGYAGRSMTTGEQDGIARAAVDVFLSAYTGSPAPPE
ncbi:TetR/AcrR family transcriptional regulator [Plantactinospora sp. GCM10030261]|uniref:TetR/AcrR family transcriptional regulator n=1 Tax=Plantactinospora sp. GCM10030261 TaxID=3273420 RepID=UPI003622EB9C